MAKPEKSKKSKNRVKVNFQGVETRARVEDGDYPGKVVEITLEEGNAAQYLKWVVELTPEAVKGRKVYYNTSLAPQALWNLRSLLEALGVEVPDSELDLDLDSYVGLEAMFHVENEVYDGKERPKITDFKPLEAETDDDEPKKSDDDDEGEEEEEEGDEESDDDEEVEEEEEGKMSAAEVREMNEKELADLVKQHSLGVKLDKLPKLSKKIAAVIDALETKGLLAADE